MNSQSSSSQDEECDLSVTPHAVVMTQGNKVKHSLIKLQAQHDEIFQL